MKFDLPGAVKAATVNVTADYIEFVPETTKYRRRITIGELLACVLVDRDPDATAPWDDDYYAHTMYHFEDPEADWANFGPMSQWQYRRGYCEHTEMCAFLVDVTCWNMLGHYRKDGASKQVASELLAMLNRKRLDTIVKWRNYERTGKLDVWSAALNICDNQFVAFSTGYLDRKEADTSGRWYVVTEIANQMQHVGFEIVEPSPKECLDPEGYRSIYRQRIHQHDIVGPVRPSRRMKRFMRDLSKGAYAKPFRLS